MCGRFTLTWDEWRRVAETLRIDDDGDVAASYRPRFNIAPTDQHFIVTSEFERRRVQRARWGLVNRRAPTAGAPASASTPRPRRSKSGRPFVRPSSSAAVSFPLTVSTSGAKRASARCQCGFISGTGSRSDSLAYGTCCASRMGRGWSRSRSSPRSLMNYCGLFTTACP